KTQITIKPYTEELAKSFGTWCKAMTSPKKEFLFGLLSGPGDEDAAPKGQLIYDQGKIKTQDILIKRWLHKPQTPLRGTGKGTVSTIYFSPKKWGYGSQCFPGQPGAAPSEILLHELVHGYRAARGHYSLAPLVGSSER